MIGMDNRSLRKGDKVMLVGEAWGDRVGGTATVGEPYRGTISSEHTLRAESDDTKWVTFIGVDSGGTDYSAVLIERDGHKVKEVLKNTRGSVFVEYEGSRESEWYQHFSPKSVITGFDDKTADDMRKDWPDEFETIYKREEKENNMSFKLYRDGEMLVSVSETGNTSYTSLDGGWIYDDHDDYENIATDPGWTLVYDSAATPTGTRDEKIEAALKQTKEDLGLCSEFDKAVERARNMTFVERLDHVAISMGRGDVFRHFEDILHASDKPEFQVGDWVLVGEDPIVSPRCRNKIGQITRASRNFAYVTFPDGLDQEAEAKYLTPADPKDIEWKVGDTVPANTVIGRRWLAKGSYLVRRPEEAHSTANVIEWIEEKEK